MANDRLGVGARQRARVEAARKSRRDAAAERDKKNKAFWASQGVKDWEPKSTNSRGPVNSAAISAIRDKFYNRDAERRQPGESIKDYGNRRTQAANQTQPFAKPKSTPQLRRRTTAAFDPTKIDFNHIMPKYNLRKAGDMFKFM